MSSIESGAAFGLNEVTIRYGDRIVVQDLTCSFLPGVNVLLGRNGAGKSSLCRILATAEKPTTGSVTVPRGRALESTLAYRSGVGWLPQSPPVASHMRTADYLEYAAWLKGVARKSRAGAVATALERTGLTARSQDRIGHLSGGMRRRVGIAQAIVHDPQLLILDEPTVGLDPEQRIQFYATLKGALNPDTVTVLSTHILEDVTELADHVLVLDRQSIQFSGTLEDFLASQGEQNRATQDVTRAFLSHLRTDGEH